jgi:hypothetical protein
LVPLLDIVVVLPFRVGMAAVYAATAAIVRRTTRRRSGGLIHNGGTGGFRSFCGFIPGIAGVGVLTNLAKWDAIDGAGIRFLTNVVRSGH